MALVANVFGIMVPGNVNVPSIRKTFSSGGIGPGNHSTIQEAVDAANPGDTIYVDPGTYYECVLINKTITLQGENRDTTIIDASGGGYTVCISADYVNISGFTMQHGDYGIYVDHSDNNTIDNNNISSNYEDGIHLLGSCYNLIKSNTATNNTRSGISSEKGDHNDIIANDVSENGVRGIGLWECTHHVIEDNIADRNGDPTLTVYGEGHSIGLWRTTYSIISNNSARSNLGSNQPRGITITRSGYNLVENNNMSGNPTGIYTTSCHNIDIINNTMFSSN
jgi:parallel beta-helix repeat protein